MGNRILYYSNGIFKPMPHDNFLINVARDNGRIPVRPLEQHLKEGKTIKVGPYQFKLEQPKRGNNSHTGESRIPASGGELPGARWPWPSRTVPGDGSGGSSGDTGSGVHRQPPDQMVALGKAA
jgi:hypothetical protein